MIYLDYNATTPLLPEVFEAMQPYFTTRWGNPSSAYRFGSQLRAEIEHAREAVAKLVGAESSQIVFTSCATESNNAAMHAALAARPGKRHLVTSAAEHSAVLNFCKAVENRGYRTTYLGVDSKGLLDLAELKAAITYDTALVSLMWANNETGVMFPVEVIAEICQSKGVLFHCDSVQAIGKISVDVRRVAADYLTMSAHKLYGPKGVGALVIRNGAPFEPMLIGGHQENGRRGGTENVGLIVGFGLAAELAARDLEVHSTQVGKLRDKLESAILAAIPATYVNGSRAERMPNTSNIGFEGIDSDTMVTYLDSQGVCVSSGSACLASALTPSHVVFAMTHSAKKAKEAVRFSLSHLTDETEVVAVCERLATASLLLRH